MKKTILVILSALLLSQLLFAMGRGSKGRSSMGQDPNWPIQINATSTECPYKDPLRRTTGKSSSPQSEQGPQKVIR